MIAGNRQVNVLAWIATVVLNLTCVQEEYQRHLPTHSLTHP